MQVEVIGGFLTYPSFVTFICLLRVAGDTLARWQESLVFMCLSHVLSNNWHIQDLNLT